jgi:hypothetical protein
MKSAIVMIVAVALGGALCGCGGSSQSPPAAANPPPTGGSPPPAGPPTDFAMFVTQQVNQPNVSNGMPVATSGLTTNLQLDNANAFSSVSFGTGDALPAGVNQASVACGQAGKSACNPAASADLNSMLN